MIIPPLPIQINTTGLDKKDEQNRVMMIHQSWIIDNGWWSRCQTCLPTWSTATNLINLTTWPSHLPYLNSVYIFLASAAVETNGSIVEKCSLWFPPTIEHKHKTLHVQLVGGRCVLHKDWTKFANADHRDEEGEILRRASWVSRLSFLFPQIAQPQQLSSLWQSPVCQIANSVLWLTAFIACIHNHHPILAPRTPFPPELWSPKPLWQSQIGLCTLCTWNKLLIWVVANLMFNVREDPRNDKCCSNRFLAPL